MSNTSSAERIKVSDADREEAIERLSHGFSVGRIDRIELEARLERVFVAKDWVELSAVFADMPSISPEPARQSESNLIVRHRRLLAMAATPFTLSVVVWLLTGTNGGFWPKWVAVASALTLAKVVAARSVNGRSVECDGGEHAPLP